MLVLKIIGWVLLGLLALLALLLLLMVPSVRLSFSAATGREMRVSAHYLFLRFPILPTKEKKKRPKKKAAAKEAPPADEEKKPGEKVPLKERLEQLRALLKTSKKILALLCRHLVIYRVQAQAAVCREDAHKTALAYVYATQLAQALLYLLDKLFVLKKPQVRISPHFSGEKSLYQISLRVRIRPIFLLAAGISLLFAYLGSQSKSRPKSKSKSKGKGGQYESAASNR